MTGKPTRLDGEDPAPGAASGALETIEIRTSPTEVVMPLVLMGALFTGVIASLDYLGPRERLIGFAVLASLLTCVGVARLRHPGPRLVISAEGLGWRVSRRGPMRQAAWSEIQSARIEPAQRKAPPFLRLVLASSSVLETVSSGELHRYVVIPIDGIDRSWDSLRTLIHRAAPHLFPPSASRADDRRRFNPRDFREFP
jgi:hypothetical protein